MRRLDNKLVSSIDWAHAGSKRFALLYAGKVHILQYVSTKSGHGWVWLCMDDPYICNDDIHESPRVAVQTMCPWHKVYEFESHQEFLAWAIVEHQKSTLMMAVNVS